MNKGKHTTKKNICHCNLLQFPPEHTMLRSYQEME